MQGVAVALSGMQNESCCQSLDTQGRDHWLGVAYGSPLHCERLEAHFFLRFGYMSLSTEAILFESQFCCLRQSHLTKFLPRTMNHQVAD